jgi:hypothetical protein
MSDERRGGQRKSYRRDREDTEKDGKKQIFHPANNAGFGMTVVLRG